MYVSLSSSAAYFRTIIFSLATLWARFKCAKITGQPVTKPSGFYYFANCILQSNFNKSIIIIIKKVELVQECSLHHLSMGTARQIR